MISNWVCCFSLARLFPVWTKLEKELKLDVIGFGSLNLDEFWEVPSEFLERFGLRVGHEYIKGTEWFSEVYPVLTAQGWLKAVDPGGSAANTTAALKKMGFSTGFYGAAGRDGLEGIRAEELGDANDLMIDVFDGPTGRCLCLINSDDESRDRCLVILPNANDLAGSAGFDESYFRESRWVHMSSFVSSSPLKVQNIVTSSLESSTRFSFDPGAVYSRLGIEVLRPLLQKAFILFTTPEELVELTGFNDLNQAIDTLLTIGASTMVLKLGSKGLRCITRESALSQEAIKPAKIIDRTGAGDVAAAGFIAGMLSGVGLEECLEFAARCASKSIEGYGRSAYPDGAFLKSFFESRVFIS